MDNALVIAALVLTGVSVAGLVVDTRAASNQSTRTFGLSALVIKLVLGVGFVLQLLRLRTVPGNIFDEWGSELTILLLVAVGVPLVGVAVACELAALPRLIERSKRSAASERTASQAAAPEDV